jgi:hypothetical protein
MEVPKFSQAPSTFAPHAKVDRVNCLVDIFSGCRLERLRPSQSPLGRSGNEPIECYLDSKKLPEISRAVYSDATKACLLWNAISSSALALGSL